MHLVRLYARVLGLLKPEAGLAWLLGWANLLVAAAVFAEPVLFGRVIERLANSQAHAAAATLANLFGLLLVWLGFGVFAMAGSTLVAMYADRLAHRRRHAALSEYFAHVLELPLAFHSAIHSGELTKVMLHGTDALWGLWVTFFRDQLAAGVCLVVLLPLSLALNWPLGGLLVLLCVVFAILTALVLRRTEAMQAAVEEHYGELAARASDTLGNVALVHSFARVEAEVSGLKHVINKLLSAQLPVLSWWALIGVLTRAATTITMLAITLAGSWLFVQQRASIGAIVTFISLAGMLMERLQNAVSFINRVFMESGKLQRFFQVLDSEPAIRERPHAIDPGRLHGFVRFKHVGFSYGGKRPAVFALDFASQPGELIALVGATGAGKSTALALLHRSFDPQWGAIEIDGHDIRSFKLTALRRNIGVVFQEAMLFDRSIAENLRVGKPDASEEELRWAAERAQALEFILAGKEGFNARVGERGRRLSGGERQRLAIARALLKDPPILILDEATSALDSATEAKVLRALEEVIKGRTTFVIAHRLATIAKANRILVLDHGQLVESGTFDQLARPSTRFAQLARGQYLDSLQTRGHAMADPR